MRWRIAAVALLALGALAPPAVPAAGPIDVDASIPGEVAVDLAADASSSLLFRIDSANFSAAAGPIQSAAVRLTHLGEPPMELAMAESAGNWTVSLPVSTPDLVGGTWQVAFVALRPGGAAVLGNRTLDVETGDSAAPQLALARPASPFVVGPGESVDLTVRDNLLRKVTFEFGGLAPTALPAPYSLRGDLLPEGRTEVTFVAYDRAAHKTTLKADVVRDTVAPAVNLTLPEHVYAGVPFLAYARVVEEGPYTLRFTVNGSAQPDVPVAGTAEPGTNRTTSFTVTPDGLGNLSLSIEAIDQVGFTAGSSFVALVEEPVTDLRVTRVAAEPSGPQFAQRPVHIRAVVDQGHGVTTLAVPVTLSVGGQSFSSVEEVPSTGPRTLGWDVQLPGGRHTATVTVEVPEGANETAPGNETLGIDVEVFLGRVLDNGTAYDIRAGSNGLPTVAVVEGKDVTYPLELVDNGRGVSYQFTTDGNRTVRWDPLNPLQQGSATSSSSSSSSSGTGASKPAPGAGPLVALAMVALAALAQRRRR